MSQAAARRAQLESEKLRQEIQQLKDENGRRWYEDPTTYTAIGAVVGIATLLGTLIYQAVTMRRQRQAGLDQVKNDAARQVAQEFRALSASLGSEDPGPRVTAAAAVEAFLGPESIEYRERVLNLLLNVLKLQKRDFANAVISRTFARALLAVQAESDGRPLKLDLALAYLTASDLRGADFTEADLSGTALVDCDLRQVVLERVRSTGSPATLDGSDLRGANLREANLDSASMLRTDFRTPETILHSAKLRHAELVQARFNGASLQSAHFENSNLVGAVFNGANLSDTYFLGATFDVETLRSIVRTASWREAHFDQQHFDELESLEIQLSR